jgi:hypothetical protein
MIVAVTIKTGTPTTPASTAHPQDTLSGTTFVGHIFAFFRCSLLATALDEFFSLLGFHLVKLVDQG